MTIKDILFNKIDYSVIPAQAEIHFSVQAASSQTNGSPPSRG